MKILGVGNLVTDHYFKNGQFIGACGGMTAFNIIANLSANFETYAVGLCGKDTDGKIAIKSLEDLGVNTQYVEKSENYTRCFNVDINDSHIISRKRCPICSRKKWYDESSGKIVLPKELLEGEKTIIVFDTVNKENITLASEARENHCINVIDIGYTEGLESLSTEQINEMIKYKFNYIQLNERVAKYLVARFNLKNNKELNELFCANMIIITYGKRGVEFVVNNKSYVYCMKNPAKEVDSTGAGDLFYSIVIEHIIQADFQINKRLLNRIYKDATMKTSKLVGLIGARALLQPLYDLSHEEGKCICGLENEMKKNTRKKTKKIATNISNLGKRIKSDFGSDAYTKTKEIIENLNGNTLFCGTGGSYSASYFASKVVNKVKGIFTEASLPRDIIYKNIKEIDNIIAFSYSGTTNDIVEVLNYGKNKNSFLITKGKIENRETEIISYLNSKSKTGKERGFLSIEGTIFPASIFAKYYYELDKKNECFEDFFLNRLLYWRDFFKKSFKENDMKYIFKCKNIFDVFYGDYTNSAAIDLESKIVETGVFRATFHEKKNFSHGRFISLEQYSPDAVIYLQTSNEGKYEEKLLEYLKIKSKRIIFIKSPFNGLIGEFDLLIAIQYFIKNIADAIDKDLSKPDYSDEAMNIYKYKVKLN